MFDDVELNFRIRNGAKVCKSCRSQELSNEYFLSKIGFDTAESGPLKVGQQLAKRFFTKV